MSETDTYSDPSASAGIRSAGVSAATSPSATEDRLAALQDRRKQRAAQTENVIQPSPLYRGVPDIAFWRNPTVWLGLSAVAGWAVGWVGYLSGSIPSWLAIAACTIANYLGFTVFHEGVHRAAHSNRTINDMLGWLPAAMLGFTYPVFRICHLNHHAHTNDPNRDPDHWVSHRPRILLPLWLISTTFNYRRLCKRNKWATPKQLAAQVILDLTIVAVTVATIATGHFWTFAVLYLVPILIAGLFLFYAFDYLPHSPFDSTERFYDTRIQPGRVRHAVLVGQNYHLIHHLWVSVPWFYYRKVFTDLEAELRKRNIRID